MIIRKKYLLTLIPICSLFLCLFLTKPTNAALFFNRGDYWGCLGPLAGDSTGTAVGNNALREACDEIANTCDWCGGWNCSPVGSGWGSEACDTQGIVWLTNMGNGSTNIFDNTIVTNQASGKIPIRLYGSFVAVNYRWRPDSSNWGREIKILYEGRWGKPGAANDAQTVSYIGNVADALNRGLGYYNSPWSSGYEPMYLTLDIDQFKREVPAGSCGDGDSSCYQSSVYVYRCAADGPTGPYGWESCGSSLSTIRVRIPHTETTTDNFSSSSRAKAGSSGWSSYGGTSNYTVTNTTADSTTVNVQFEHNIKNNGSKAASVNWSVGSSYGKSGSTTISAGATANASSYSFDVKVTRGTSRTICQTISHDQTVTITETILSGSVIASSISRSGTASSSACVKISYPGTRTTKQTFTSTTQAKAGSAGWSSNGGTSTYTVPNTVTSKNTTVKVEFKHNIKNDGTRFSAAPKYYIYRDNSQIDSGTSSTISPGATINVKSYSIDVSVNMGTSKTICQTTKQSSFITVVETMLDGVAINTTSSLSSTLGSSSACATIKFPYYYQNRTTTQSFSSTSYVQVHGKTSYKTGDNNTYEVTGALDNQSIQLDFKHDIKNHSASTSASLYSSGTFSRPATPQWNVVQGSSAIKSGSTKINYNTTSTVDTNSYKAPIHIGRQSKVCQYIKHSGKVTFTDIVRSDGLTDSSKDPKTKWDSTGELSGSANSASACITIFYPRRFETEITSSITDSPVYTGETTTISGEVKLKSGSNATPEDTIIKLVSFTLPKSYNPTANSLSATTLTYNGNTTDEQLEKYFKNRFNGIDNFNATYKTTDPKAIKSSERIERLASIPDVTPGMKFCTAALVNYYKSADSGMDADLNKDRKWNISGISCSPIAKKPNFQVWNGDLYTPGAISTSTSRKLVNDKTLIFGSWDEQLVIAKNTVNGFASGATLGYDGNLTIKPGGHSNTDDFRSLSPLTISNSKSETTGNANIHINSSIIERLRARFAPESIKDVEVIDHNIILPDVDYDSVNGLNQNIIFAKEGIEISPNVTRIDAWLVVEDGYINTCSSFKETFSDTTVCNNSLKINGPIFAKELRLNRTAGAGHGNNSIDPAEVFNFRPDAYLWSFSQAQTFSEAYVTYSRELAPRY